MNQITSKFIKLTIGMPSYNNFTEVFFTVQSLRMHHDLTDCEILIVDNFGDPELEKFVRNQGGTQVRYERCLGPLGPSGVKNKVFELAYGEMVMCIDSHVLLVPGALKNIPITDDLIHGPLMYCDTKNYSCGWEPTWRDNMWGIWGNSTRTLPTEPFSIWGCGMGLFLTKRNTWLGYNKQFKGFGGEEGYIHEKYRQAGRKVLCHPDLIWMHMFDRKIPYPVILQDRIHNYIIGFKELNLSLQPIIDHFGISIVNPMITQLNTNSNIII